MTDETRDAPPAQRRPVVAVVGSARVEDPAWREVLLDLGEQLVDAGFRLVTGGLSGTMRLVSRGGRRSAAWQEGRIIGVVPSYDHDQANPYCDIVIPTGMQVARNVLVVATADVVVATGGGAGTLSEIALAWQLARPVVALGDRGWAGRLAGQCLDHRCPDPIRPAGTVAEAVDACRALWPAGRKATDIRAH